MNDEPKAAELPTDDEIALAIASAEGRDPTKTKPKDDEPSRRLPEALWFYLMMLFEAVILAGVWGFMLRGPNEVIKHGPTLESPIMEQVQYHLLSIWYGFVDQITERPWILIGVAVASMLVFVPGTSRGRKRVARLLSGAIAALFAALIALQFQQDLTSTVL